LGAGLGGCARYISEEYGARVHAVDLSVNMVLTALERGAAAQTSVSFEIADVTSMPFAPGAYDAVYSRDVLLHVADKPRLFDRVFASLRPGGRLVITDYCRAAAPPSPAFQQYISARGYALPTVDEYADMLRGAGFVHVTAEDQSDKFLELLRGELQGIEGQREAIIAELSAEDYEELAGNWRDKIERVEGGEQRWGVFVAMKPRFDVR
jgi:phosphoethanolamine N-methyltransferase